MVTRRLRCEGDLGHGSIRVGHQSEGGRRIGVDACRRETHSDCQRSYEAYAYVVDIVLPNKLVIRGVEVTESDQKVCDTLIGMDVISLGDMKVTNKPTTKFIFRIPAEGDTPLLTED